MTAPVDVLAVLSDLAADMGDTPGTTGHQIAQVRAAVAELIEAADKAKWGLYVGADVAWALADLQRRGLYAPRCADGKPSRADAGKDLQTIQDAYAVVKAAISNVGGA